MPIVVREGDMTTETAVFRNPVAKGRRIVDDYRTALSAAHAHLRKVVWRSIVTQEGSMATEKDVFRDC